MPEIVFLMGKSATGKDHIYELLAQDKELSLKKVTIYTTRPMREGETDGGEYYFVSNEQAEKFEKEGKIIEMRCYHTVFGVWKYFTLNDGQIEFADGKRYIVIGTLEAYDCFCKYYGKEHILPIYIKTDDKIRLNRAIEREAKQRKPEYTEVCRRFLADEEDFSEDNLKKSGINRCFLNNTALSDCVEQIRNEIIASSK